MSGQLAAAERYRWVALANTTAAVFMSALDGSIVTIALPAIFRGIHLDPLAPGNVLTGREFFPHLIAAPFDHGLSVVFAGGALLAILAGAASLLRGQPIRADRPAGRAGRRPSVPSARR